MAQYTILLIDDEALVREELGGLLEDEGFSLITASNGDEGLSAFREQKPDMVITDVRMPRTDGLSVAMTIRNEAPHVPVTVITGHGNEAMVIEALRAGVTDFLKKPVRWDALSLALNRMIDVVRSPHRLVTHDMPGSIELLERSWSYRLTNCLADIPSFVTALLNDCAADVSDGACVELSVALRELLINAIEHGNLEISYEDKSKALESGTLRELIEARLAVPRLAARSVIVQATRNNDSLQVRISDEGNGFAWRELPDPTDPSNLLAEHGRGVLLARLSVDELTYAGHGNEVRVVKRVPSGA